MSASKNARQWLSRIKSHADSSQWMAPPELVLDLLKENDDLRSRIMEISIITTRPLPGVEVEESDSPKSFATSTSWAEVGERNPSSEEPERPQVDTRGTFVSPPCYSYTNPTRSRAAAGSQQGAVPPRPKAGQEPPGPPGPPQQAGPKAMPGLAPPKFYVVDKTSAEMSGYIGIHHCTLIEMLEKFDLEWGGNQIRAWKGNHFTGHRRLAEARAKWFGSGWKHEPPTHGF